MKVLQPMFGMVHIDLYIHMCVFILLDVHMSQSFCRSNACISRIIVCGVYVLVGVLWLRVGARARVCVLCCVCVCEVFVSGLLRVCVSWVSAVGLCAMGELCVCVCVLMRTRVGVCGCG